MRQVRESSSYHAHAFPLLGASVATPAPDSVERHDTMARRQPAHAVSSKATAFGFDGCGLVPLGRFGNRNAGNADESMQSWLACAAVRQPRWR